MKKTKQFIETELRQADIDYNKSLGGTEREQFRNKVVLLTECLAEIEANFKSLNNFVERSAIEERKRRGDDDGGHDPCYG